MKNYTQLSAYERDLIGFYLSSGDSINSISNTLRRSKSTISQEIRRNSVNGRYLPILAQQSSTHRKSITNSLNPKIPDYVWDFVSFCLHIQWSPEQISGRIKYVISPNDSSRWITAETIYERIYSKEHIGLKLFELLPRKHTKRKFKHRKWNKSKIPNRISISHRSEDINDRSEFGHWEGDSVLGIGKKQGIHTEVERKSRYLRIRKIPAVNSAKSIRAQVCIFSQLPECSRKSTTLDNGPEFVLHDKLSSIGMDQYFAHPYSSWERGCNEYHNALVRRTYPKHTDFKKVTKYDIDYVETVINCTPRKCLKYETPTEVFEREIKSQSVRVRT